MGNFRPDLRTPQVQEAHGGLPRPAGKAAASYCAPVEGKVAQVGERAQVRQPVIYEDKSRLNSTSTFLTI